MCIVWCCICSHSDKVPYLGTSARSCSSAAAAVGYGAIWLFQPWQHVQTLRHLQQQCCTCSHRTTVPHLGAAVRQRSSAAAAWSQHKIAAPAVAAGGLLRPLSAMLRKSCAALVAILRCQLTSARACLACFAFTFSACHANNMLMLGHHTILCCVD